MRMHHLLAACVAVLSLTACDGRKTEAPPAAPATGQAPAPKTSGPSITGDFKLVKNATNAQVFVLQHGKTSPVTNWAWVERNAAGKQVEVITQKELESYPSSGVVYE